MELSGIENKIVYITGGASGIGRSIVIEFCKNGADVIFSDIDEVKGNALCEDMKGYKCRFIKVDVSDDIALQNSLKQVIEEKGNIDIIVNNAGIGGFGAITEQTFDDFDNVLKTNLYPTYTTSREFAKHRKSHPELNTYGRIINIASTRWLMSEPDTEAYAASKGAIVSLTHSLAISLSKYNITVNCISPGWIDTGNFGELKPTDHHQHPSGRVGIPDDIARMCLFLCQPENNFINGQNFVIDGGMTKKMIYEE